MKYTLCLAVLVAVIALAKANNDCNQSFNILPRCQPKNRRSFQIGFQFDKNRRRCTRRTFYDCDGKQNRFARFTDCMKCLKMFIRGELKIPASTAVAAKPKACLQSINRGRYGPGCKRQLRYFYYSKTKTCFRSFYLGCSGNDNNFPTRTACENTCKNGKPAPAKPAPAKPTTPLKPSAACFDKISLGRPGKACRPGPRYFYLSRQRRCIRLTYRGCSGNNNNFASQSVCEEKCVRAAKPAPKPAPKPGPGKSPECNERRSIGDRKGSNCKPSKKFYFNSYNKACRPFFYMGCGGNSNRFDTYQQCRSKCMA